MDRSHRDQPPRARAHGGRFRREPAPGRRSRPEPLTPEGVPAAVEGAPPPSPIVWVTAESRARYPWLPPRVIAGSVWRGPAHVRVRVGEDGRAAPWRCPAARR